MAALNEISLRNLAGQLGPDWEKLATYLGFTVAQIDSFKIDYHGQENQIFRMLVKWKQQQGASPNPTETLSEKLKQAGRKDLADILSEIQELEVSLQDMPATRKALSDNAAKARQRVQDRAAEVIAKVKAEEKRLLDEITSQEREQNKRLDEHEKTLGTKLHSLSQYSAISKGMEKLGVQPTPKAAGLKSHPVFVKSQKLDIDLGKVMVEDTWEMSHSFGAQGSGEGEFESARGIAAAADPDEIAVADWENDRVVICNHQGQTKNTIPIVANDVVAISNQWVCAHPDKMMVYDRADTTHKFDFHTVPEDEVGKTDVWLVSVAVMPNGNIIAGDGERKVLTEHNPRNGEILHTMPVKITPDFLAVLSNGWIVISDLEQGLAEIEEVSNGIAVTVNTIKPIIDGKPVKSCRGVCSNSSGIYLAADTGHVNTGHIHHYTCVGQFVSCVAQGLYDPYGITFTATGQQLAVADLYSVKIYHKLSKLMPDSRSLKEPVSRDDKKEEREIATEKLVGSAFEKIDTHLECRICTDKYKQPKVLNCLHSFCEECLVKYRDDTYGGAPQIPCPVCGQDTVLPKSGIQGLKTNFHLVMEFEGQVANLRQDSRSQMKSVSGDAKKEEKGTSSPKPTLLQTLLKEFRRMTEDFTEIEKLENIFKLPYIAIAYFNEKGGRLTLEEYNVHLYIPRGALAREPQLVYIFVDPSAPPVDGVDPPFVALSPMIQCGPTGLEFLDNVVLSFPHHANNEWELSTHMCLTDEASPKTWQGLHAKSDGAMVLSRDRKAVLLLKHFTIFAVAGIPNAASAKRVVANAFGSLYDPSDSRYAARIHIWNNDSAAEKKVFDDETHLDSKPLDVSRYLDVLHSQGDVNVYIDQLKTGWEMEEQTSKEQTISKSAVWQFPTNSVTFDFTRDTNHGATTSVSNQPDTSLPGCNSFVHQFKADSTDSSWEGQKVRLSVRPKQIRTSSPIEIRERRMERSSLNCQQEALKRALKKKTDEEMDGGRLSKETVQKLARFLECESDDRSNWIRLAEELFGQPKGTELIESLRQGMPDPAKEVLKVYFLLKPHDLRFDREAIGYLLKVFKRLNMTEAVQIMQDELKIQADETFFWKLANDMGGEWERLASLLESTATDVKTIKEENPNNVAKQIVTVLVRWRRQIVVDGNNWASLLAENLVKIGRADLEKSILEYASSSEAEKNSVHERQ